MTWMLHSDASPTVGRVASFSPGCKIRSVTRLGAARTRKSSSLANVYVVMGSTPPLVVGARDGAAGEACGAASSRRRPWRGLGDVDSRGVAVAAVLVAKAAASLLFPAAPCSEGGRGVA